MRLIDADVLKEELKAKKVFITGVRNGRKIFTELVESLKESFVSVIDEQPTIEDKYGLHDLRKNPDDLPEAYENCEICFLDKCYHTAYLNEDNVWELPMDGSPNETFENVIAWREIEPFEEAKE